MNNNSNSESCAKTCWLVALAVGLLVAMYLWLGAGWGFFWALIVGVVIIVLGGKFLPQFFCSEAAGQQEAVSDVAPIATADKPAAPAPVSRSEPEPEPEPEPEQQPAPTPEPEPAKPASVSVIRASTSLPGQTELASRRGSWRYQGDANETAPPPQSPARQPDPEPVSESGGTRPQGLAEAREGGGDDLKMIKGVGPKMEQLLNSMGYFHFDQIAGWSGSDVAWVDDNLKGFKGRVSRDNWVGQAKSLAAGEETDFARRAKKDGMYD